MIIYLSNLNINFYDVIYLNENFHSWPCPNFNDKILPYPLNINNSE